MTVYPYTTYFKEEEADISYVKRWPADLEFPRSIPGTGILSMQTGSLHIAIQFHIPHRPDKIELLLKRT